VGAGGFGADMVRGAPCAEESRPMEDPGAGVEGSTGGESNPKQEG